VVPADRLARVPEQAEGRDDEGQLALMPDNRAWCIVSDLIQGVGTVVIAAPEGNMKKYFESLERVIALDPAASPPDPAR